MDERSVILHLLTPILKSPSNLISCSAIMTDTVFDAAFVLDLMAEASVENGKNVHLILERLKLLGISILCVSVFLSIWRLASAGIVE